MLELPAYHWPHLHNLALGLWERARIFLTRVGTIILTLMVLVWFLSSFPGAPEGATQPPIYYSIAGMLGRALAVIFAPIGFGWQICIALVPGMAAREVAVGALGTVYALSQSGDDVATSLTPMHRAVVDAGHRAVAAGLVRVRAAVPVDPVGGAARDGQHALVR